MGTKYYTKIVVKCDECPEVIDDEWNPPEQEEIEIGDQRDILRCEREWREDLEKKGWKFKDDDLVLCPKCANKTELEKNVERVNNET